MKLCTFSCSYGRHGKRHSLTNDLEAPHPARTGSKCEDVQAMKTKATNKPQSMSQSSECMTCMRVCRVSLHSYDVYACMSGQASQCMTCMQVCQGQSCVGRPGTLGETGVRSPIPTLRATRLLTQGTQIVINPFWAPSLQEHLQLHANPSLTLPLLCSLPCSSYHLPTSPQPRYCEATILRATSFVHGFLQTGTPAAAGQAGMLSNCMM